MPSKPLRPCQHAGCPLPAVRFGRCAQHAREYRQRIDAARPGSAQRGYDGEWRRIRKAYLEEHPYCVRCGAPATDVDHIRPLSRGGTHDETNLQALCHGCHSRKTARHDGRWGKGRQNR